MKFRSTGNDHNTNSELHSNSDLDLQMNCGKCIATYVHYGFLRENRSTMQKNILNNQQFLSTSVFYALFKSL